MKTLNIFYLIVIYKCLSTDLSDYIVGPEGWCFNFYRVNLTWEQAKQACKEDGSISDLAIITNAFSSTWLTIKSNATFGQGSSWWANAIGIYNDNKTFPGYNYWNDSDHTPMVYNQFSHIWPIEHKLTCLVIDSQTGFFMTKYCNQTYNYVCFYKPTDKVNCLIASTTTTTSPTTITTTTTTVPKSTTDQIYSNIHTLLIFLCVILLL